MVRQILGHISSRLLSCHRPLYHARCESINSIPSHSATILLVVRFALVRWRFLLSLCRRLSLPLRSFLSDEECLRHDSIVNLDKFLNKLCGILRVKQSL